MTIEKRPFGQTKSGKPVELYTLKDGEVSVDIITYGAAIRSINVPAGGKIRDVALGFDDIAGYEANKGYHGAVIGRIGNRVANAEYTMNGRKYKLDANEGVHSLHGGFIGFDKQVWIATAQPDTQTQQASLLLTLTDKEGTAAGYPGDMTVSVKYTLKGSTGDGGQKGCILGIEYTAVCTEDTPVNLTNHCYFNLAGHGAGSILNHKVQILSDKITAVDDTIIPTGELMDVTNTPLDLREAKIIGDGVDSGNAQIKYGGGYDHNWVLSDIPYREPELAAVVTCAGLKMKCLTTKPGIQFYCGNMMQGETGKDGAVYSKRTGLCLETQYWPNAVNTPSFPAPILRKGETYKHKTIYKFEEE